MRGPVLLLSVAVALCGAAPPLEPVTCSGDKHETNAVRFAIQHINNNHNHGYKFQLSEVLANKVEQNGQGCSIEMQVNLKETKCHYTNPKDFEDCEVRSDSQTVVTAVCVVILSVQNNVNAVVLHKCETTKDETIGRRCPDCPNLMHLNNEEGLNNIRGAVRMYNLNNATDHYYVLRDVGRISASYMMQFGMNYVTEFAMVETHCPVGSRIVPETCTPLCPDRARHVFCKTSDNVRRHSIVCETYPAVNKTALMPGENEPLCPQPHDQCSERPANQAIHTICSWPRPQLVQQRN